MALSNEQRQMAEKQIVYTLLTTANSMGYALASIEDEKNTEGCALLSIMDTIFASDECNLYFTNAAGRRFWVYLVFGNDGYDVICDHSVSFDPVILALEPVVNAWQKKAGF